MGNRIAIAGIKKEEGVFDGRRMKKGSTLSKSKTPLFFNLHSLLG
jgi:hypothetical protein